MPLSLYDLRAREIGLADRYAFTARILRSACDALPEVRPWDCPPWLRVRVLELAGQAQRIEDDLGATRADIERTVADVR